MIDFPVSSLLRWTSIPLAIAVLASTVKSFIAGPGWILACLLGTLCLMGWAVVLLVSTIRAAFRRHWRRVALLCSALVGALPLISIGTFSGDYVHLALMYPYYAVQIRQSPDWQSKETRFYWGDEAVTVLDGLRARTLVYDASGKTVVGDRPDDTNVGGLRLNVQHLIGNFYLETCYSG
jgi:hypothetical protein